MNQFFISNRVITLLFGFLFLALPAAGQGIDYRIIQLPTGISLEIPALWEVLPLEPNKGKELTKEAIVDQAGIGWTGEKRVQLLKVKSMPAPSGAMIRLNVFTSAELNQGDLAATGPDELKALRAELFELFKRVEMAGGPRILELETPRVELLNDHLALVIPYLRESGTDNPWAVVQFKIPVANRLIELTLSYRQGQAAIWKPILEHVWRSLKF
jgi:hypothetical protein